ncbi:MAG: bifunctional sulfate adenylyltransferase/adenylylsulfate kinase [Parachlamydia sp.]|nr:bifunctional sulfate adenylyltransferase/adenylylsulfate kinase [Parachlamydia sp.]
MTARQTSKYLSALVWLLLLPLLISQTSTSSTIPSLTLTQRQLCDIELLMNGGFAPLDGFMDSKTYDRVVQEMRLPDGSVWPMPIVLDINDKIRQKIAGSSEIILRDPEGFVLAYMKVSDIWKPNKEIEAQKVYGTSSQEHPGVDYLFNQMGEFYVGGRLDKVTLPKHYDFPSLRKTPDELKAIFKEKGYKKIVAFQTRNPMHRAHLELTTRAAKSVGAHLLVHPVVGMTKPGDVDYFTRVKCYKKLIKYYPEGGATLSLLPISMRMAGPREAVWHAIIRRNYGCTHFIVGRDHAGPGKDSSGKDFYEPYDAQELAKSLAKEIGITIVPFKEMVYVKEDNNYQPIDEVPSGKTVLNISGTQLRKMLREGKDIPEWFSFPEVFSELRKVYPPRLKQGFTLFFTGLSGSGKSTIANGLGVKLMEMQNRAVTVLDGDLIRLHLSSELGFSKEHRSLNVRRVGFVASEISKNGGVAICALIAPYEADRIYNRKLISNGANYIEIYVCTSLDECERRDTKGLYAMAREGKLKGFTGIDDPYEVPTHPEVVIDAANCNVSEAIEKIIDYLRKEEFVD